MLHHIRADRLRIDYRPLLLFYILILLPLGFLRGLAAQDPIATGVYNDIDAFFLAGQMFWEGNLSNAYSLKEFSARMASDSSKDIVMPWTYPPQFNFITALLSLAPRDIFYWTFISITTPIYFVVMWMIARRHIVTPLTLILPTIIILVLSGQNGFLTAGLMGVYIVMHSRQQANAGLPLGFMVIKPHLAVGLAWYSLLNLQWRNIFLAASVVILTSLLATVVFGPQVWISFYSAIGESAERMDQGEYPLFRMVSIYAFVFSVSGGNTTLSLVLHLVFAGLSMAVCTYGFFKKWKQEHVLALACFATLTISPYCYDYDVTIFSLGLALIAEDLLKLTNRLEKVALFATCWLMSGWGLACILAYAHGERIKTTEQPISLGGLGLILACLLLWRILARIASTERQKSLTTQA